MKKIGIFEIDKNMCSNCREDENCPQKYSVNGNCLHIEKDLAIEQVPETWEELKELCKDLDCISFGKAGQTQDTEYIALDNRLYFYKDGTVDFGFDNLAYPITPARMWRVIKDLIGEE